MSKAMARGQSLPQLSLPWNIFFLKRQIKSAGPEFRYTSGMHSQFIKSNHVQLHVMTDARENGPPVMLLHGFPERHYGWHKQIPALVEAGFHVIVPDQRGYNLSDKPKGISSYDITMLTADVIGLLDHFKL